LGQKVAIITGAARGLGATIARLFVGEGASVLLTDVRDEEGIRLAAGIGEGNNRAVYQHLDVTNESDWEAAVDRCERDLGTPDVLVNNAFVRATATLTDESVEHWRRSLDVNLTGAFLGMRAVLPGMRAKGSGSIVSISSANGGEGRGFPSHAAYWAAKGGLTTLTRNAGITYAGEGVRANVILPGPMRTPIVEESMPALQQIALRLPIPRIAEPEEVAWAAVFLASDESSYTTGATLVIDGGQTTTVA
jgi:3alpha(or 20beta)-hydroxysteroid dehydrogenase